MKFQLGLVAVITTCVAAGVVVGGSAVAQKFAPFKQSAARLTCYQNGTEVLSVDTEQLRPEGRGDYYIEYVTQSGTLGQIRFASDTICVAEGRAGDEPAV